MIYRDIGIGIPIIKRSGLDVRCAPGLAGTVRSVISALAPKIIEDLSFGYWCCFLLFGWGLFFNILSPILIHYQNVIKFHSAPKLPNRPTQRLQCHFVAEKKWPGVEN